MVRAFTHEIKWETRMQHGLRNMGIGALVCLVGIVITAATYSAASPGGHYVVAWGAIVFGALQFFRGLFQLASGSGAQG